MNDKTLSCLGMIALLVIAVTVGAVMNGWAFTILWTWFVVPLFHLATPTIPQSIGIGILVSLLVNHAPNTKDDRDLTEKISAVFSETIARPILALIIGAIVRMFL